MPDAMVAWPELEVVDSLIAGLEGLIAESDETPLRIEVNKSPKRATYRVLNPAGPSGRRLHHAEAVYLDGGVLVLRCQDTPVVRQTQLQVTVQAEKSGRGEVIAIIQGRVRELKRISGGYDIDIEITEMRKTKVSPAQKLRDCINNSDATSWNRWCHDIGGTIELMGMDLRMVDLNGYDLCCADFSGSDFSGANLSGAILAGADLSHCIMEKVTAAGADFFHARMNRAQAALLQQSGMPEVESVVFEAARHGGEARDNVRQSAAASENAEGDNAANGGMIMDSDGIGNGQS